MGADFVWQVVFMPGQHPTSEGAVTQKKALLRLSSKVCFELLKTFLAAQFRSHVQSSSQNTSRPPAIPGEGVPPL